MWRRAAILILGCEAFACTAADSVRVKFRPGYPLSGVSVETSEVVVTRESRGNFRDVAVDLYFAEVKSALAEAGGKASCTEFAVDFPVVTIQIELEGQFTTLECNPLPLDSTISSEETYPESIRQRTFQRIVKLTLERAKQRIGR
jgi:hypothetical protein